MMPERPNAPPSLDDPLRARAPQQPNGSAAAPPDGDEEAIDFGRLPPLDEGSGSAAVPLGQLSGPLSGASIVSWAELVRTAEDEKAGPEEHIDLYNPAPVQVDADSDKDLLRQ